MENENFLTIEEMARRLKLSKTTIYRMVKSGQLPAAKFGRSWRASESDFDGCYRDAKGGDKSGR